MTAPARSPRSQTPSGQPEDPRSRFLREIGARLPIQRVTELHLFPAIRQGGVESGAAVVAVAPMLEQEVPIEPSDDESDEHPRPSAGVDRTVKHTVYTATYRLVLKGADRGKWEAAVVAEAEAPLQLVDTVVQGVQRRLGDEGEPERLAGESLHALLRSAVATGPA